MNGAKEIGFLDATPFRAILMERLEELEQIESIPDPKAQLAMEVGLSDRLVYMVIAQKQPTIGFDKADQIVTRILGPMAWHENEELNAIYESVDLNRLDWGFPVSETVKSELRETAVRFIKELGTSARAAEALGISTGTVGRYAREARAEA